MNKAERSARGAATGHVEGTKGLWWAFSDGFFGSQSAQGSDRRQVRRRATGLGARATEA